MSYTLKSQADELILTGKNAIKNGQTGYQRIQNPSTLIYFIPKFKNYFKTQIS